MRALTATGVVHADHTLTVTLPPDIPPGPRTVVVVIEESAPAGQPVNTLDLTPHPVGPTEPSCTFRREDLYGEDGR
jgi:hypothetical protein